MAFIKTIPENQAEGLLQELYKIDREKYGYVPNYTQAFSLHPEVFEKWRALIGEIRSKMKMRRYELITFAAAMAMDCTYWMLSHGALLRKNFFNVDQMLALIKDFHQANLAPDEVALMNFAQLVIKEPYRISNNDIEELRMYGFSDDEILDIVLVASARSLFSKTLDALGVEPDAAYLDLEPELINALAIGRPFPVEEITKVKRWFEINRLLINCTEMIRPATWRIFVHREDGTMIN